MPVSLQSMIDGASLPFSDPASLFKNPASTGIAELNASNAGLAMLGGSMPGFDIGSVTTQVTSSIAGITGSLQTQVSAINTNLPLAMAAQGQQTVTTTVDSIVAGTLDKSGAQQIDSAFPVNIPPVQVPPVPTPPTNTICPADTVDVVMAPITKASATVSAGNDATAAPFNNTGPLSALYTALNAIPGVVVTTGKELLAFLGNIPGPLVGIVTGVVNAAIAGVPGLLSQLTSSMNSVYDPANPTAGAISGMTDTFTGLVDAAAAKKDEAMKFVLGSSTVNMINSTNPCVQKVMAAAVNPAAVDTQALAVVQGLKDKTISLPGQESVVAANATKPLEISSPVNNPIVPAAQMSGVPAAGPTIDPYTRPELDDFVAQVEAQVTLVLAWKKQSSTWYKENVEDWKQQVSYESKKTAAGATTAAPYGTSSDPAALAAWKAVYDGTPAPNNYVYKRDYFNSFYLTQALELEKVRDDMASEYKQRGKYGKFPYTYQMAQGYAIPESKQYTYLAPTK